ncbi:hypothetical protein IV203_021003 [Nitzschia inconspicua]|uniref:Uncharacterized protein n=1 Tax=Nitzschia inconspicua TaxID=303405 RepID=A0A9K3KG45_9STRA|nr:hypothetical protein IV203_021003 [Nitzschia inconspicua]
MCNICVLLVQPFCLHPHGHGACLNQDDVLFQGAGSESPAATSQQRVDLYESIVPKFLYVALHTCPDILPAFTFLCNWLSDQREQSWNKIRRLLQHITGTISLPGILGGGTLTQLKTWVNASYANHSNLKKHTGGAVSLELGTFMCKFQKQKLNTTDRDKTEGLNIVHCPTEEMLADFTKPLQGALIQKLSDLILGHKPLISLSVPVTSLREERVGSWKG